MSDQLPLPLVIEQPDPSRPRPKLKPRRVKRSSIAPWGYCKHCGRILVGSSYKCYKCGEYQ